MALTREYPLSDYLSVTRAGAAWSFGSDGSLVEAAPNTLRHDYDPATLAYRGVLGEETGINLVPNPRWEGTVPGTPGTAPSNFNAFNTTSSGVTREIVGVTTEAGMPCLDLRWYGTPSALLDRTIRAFSTTAVPAAQGQNWTMSSFMRVLSASGTWSVRHTILELNSGGSQVAAGNSFFTPASTGLITANRVAFTRTLTEATTAYMLGDLIFRFTSGAAVDLTVRIAGLQIEQATSASSLILPPVGTPGAATRNADDIAAASIGRWYSADTGTLVVDFTPGQTTADGPRGIVTLDDGTGSNRVELYMLGASPGVRLLTVSGGVTQVSNLVVGDATVLARNTLRLSWGPAGWFVSLNGAAPVTASLGTLPTSLARMRLGNRGGILTDYLQGWIAPRVAHYPVQYTDTASADGFTIRNR